MKNKFHHEVSKTGKKKLEKREKLVYSLYVVKP